MTKFPSEILTLMMMTLMLIILFNFTLSTSLHPIYMVMLLVLYTLTTCLIISKWAQNFIYSIMLFMIMISGLLIMFLYFSSLISNEQNNFNFKPLMITNFLINLMFISYYFINFNESPKYTSMENMQMNYLNMNMFQNIMYIYSYPFNNLTLICMLYLLITLLMIIKICSIKNSSLRKLK